MNYVFCETEINLVFNLVIIVKWVLVQAGLEQGKW